MARVALSTWLMAAPETVWRHVQTPRLLQHVAAPLLGFSPVSPRRFPRQWSEGDFVVAIRLFGVIPLGRQTVGARLVESEAWPRVLLDDGHSALIRRWHHVIRISPAGQGTRYVDEVEIDAGVLTPVVSAFARLFYAHRQRRWRALAASGFRALR